MAFMGRLLVMTESEGRSVAADLPPGWHLACGLAVSFGYPIAAAFLIAGVLLGQDAFSWAGAGSIVLTLPFAFGLELLARSVVKAQRGSLRGWASEIEITQMRLHLLSRGELQHSLERLGLVDPGVFVARLVTWIASAAITVGAIVIAAMR